jgi:hypothetical protein
MVANTTAIAEALSRIDHKFDLMYAKVSHLCVIWTIIPASKQDDRSYLFFISSSFLV